MKKMKDDCCDLGVGLRGESTKIPATPRICRHDRRSDPWQYSPAPGFRGVISQENNSRKNPVNLSKNPVNLSKFIEFFGNSLSSSEAIGSAMIPAFSSSPVPATAGKCGGRRRSGRSIPIDGGGAGSPRDGEIPPHANLSVYSRAPRLPPPQLRANAGRTRAGSALAPFAGGVEKPPERVIVIPLKGKPHKGNPPYPPLSGGYEKPKPLAGGGVAFFYPPDKGG